MLSEIVHVDAVVCLHQVFVGFDGERLDQVQIDFRIREDAHDIGSARDALRADRGSYRLVQKVG